MFTRESLFDIYPNPAQKEITIRSNSIKSYQLFSIQGDLIEQKLLSQPETKLDVSTLPNGIYIIKVESESKKWIKN